MANEIIHAEPVSLAEKQRAKAPLNTGARVSPIIPRNIEEVARVADAVIKAGLAPDSYKSSNPQETASRIMIGIMKGAEVGLPPLTALSTIAIINNRPCIWGDGAVALIQSHGLLEKMTTEEIGSVPNNTVPVKEFPDDYGIEVRMWRKGQSEPYVGRFTVGDAKRAGLWLHDKKEPWRKYPRRQMKWRAFSWPARDGFSDCLMGLGIREEVEDLPPVVIPIDSSALDDTATDPLQIDHKPEAPLFTLKDAAGKARVSWDTGRPFLSALHAELDAASDIDALSIWANNADTVRSLPAEFQADRESLLAIYEPNAQAAE
jgi:hypothetical protein